MLFQWALTNVQDHIRCLDLFQRALAKFELIEQESVFLSSSDNHCIMNMWKLCAYGCQAWLLKQSFLSLLKEWNVRKDQFRVISEYAVRLFLEQNPQFPFFVLLLTTDVSPELVSILIKSDQLKPNKLVIERLKLSLIPATAIPVIQSLPLHHLDLRSVKCDSKLIFQELMRPTLKHLHTYSTTFINLNLKASFVDSNSVHQSLKSKIAQSSKLLKGDFELLEKIGNQEHYRIWR